MTLGQSVGTSWSIMIRTNYEIVEIQVPFAHIGKK